MWMMGVLAAVVVGAVWLAAVTLGHRPEADGRSGDPVTVAAGRLYGRPWSMTATRDAGDTPCFRLRMSDRFGRPLLPGLGCDRPIFTVKKAGEWLSMGLDSSRIMFAFGVAAPGVARYELVLPDAARVRVTPVAYGGVRYFGFAYSTDRLANYVETVVGYDSAGRRVLALDPWSEGRPGPVPRVSALRARPQTMGSGVIDGVAWRVQQLPPKPAAAYVRAGFPAETGGPGGGTVACDWWTVAGRNESSQCGSWHSSVYLDPHMPINGPCRPYGVPTVCFGTVDPWVDRLVLVLNDGRRQTLHPVAFHGYRFTAFAFPTDHPARSLTAYDRQGHGLAYTDRLTLTPY